MPELPPPLPPAERTVIQLVAETIRFYGENFWRALPLGLPLAVGWELIGGREIDAQIAVLCALAPLFSAAYVYASLLTIGGRQVSRGQILSATAIGVIVWLPAPLGLRAYVLPVFVWLALFGLAVPAAIYEELGLRAAIARGWKLATGDFVHAFGSLCTLVVVVTLSAGVLSALLHGQGENTKRVAFFLAWLVLSPLLYLGGALLYADQEARLGSGRPARRSKP